jgi:protein-tyrosine phosphatase
MIDFHSHVLPDVDDGAKDVAESLKLLEAQAQQGVRAVVATPHFYPRYDSPERFLRRRERAEALLRREMEGRVELPQLFVGAEVHFFRGMSESEFLPLLTIQGKKCIMVEMPEPPWSAEMYRELENIHIKLGLTPIVAHVDRYIAPLRTGGIPEKLSRLPVLVQANAEFFTDRHTASMAVRMLHRGQIHLLGSDCHNLTDRAPNLGAAVDRIREKLGETALRHISHYEHKVLG